MVFIMDESNVLDSSFLERINTLLANGEVCQLFTMNVQMCWLCCLHYAHQHVYINLNAVILNSLYQYFFL